MNKRGRDEAIYMADCLMLLSKVGQAETPNDRLFACKTCNKKFTSFQALGGHCASHKKPKLGGDNFLKLPTSSPKTHECPICGLEFPIGQALGGHMRRHRGNRGGDHRGLVSGALLPMPVLKKSSSKRVLCLDLNLSPMEDELTLRLGKVQTPVVLQCFI